ncbi:hypothetical protein Tco_0085771 [Tanacetum coccineum]
MDDLIRNRTAKLVAFQQEIDTLKETLSTHVKEKESLAKTLTVFKTESKEKESKYIDKEIVLEKQNKELENIISLGNVIFKPTLYDGNVIFKEHVVISMTDDEETLILKEETRSTMLDKLNDPILLKHKINISPIDYSKLNKIKEDFGKRFVTKKELSAEQAFWLKHSNYNPDTSVKSHTPVRIEAPSELPRVNKARVIMSSATSAVTYTSVYTDSEPGRAFWGADDEEVSEGGIPRVIVLGYDGLPIQPVAPPSPDYIPGPEDPQTPPIPQDEDEHEFSAEEQPLPPVDSPTAESPGHVTESDPEEDPEEYEDDETEDGPVDYPMDGGDDGDDDDGDSSRIRQYEMRNDEGRG